MVSWRSITRATSSPTSPFEPETLAKTWPLCFSRAGSPISARRCFFYSQERARTCTDIAARLTELTRFLWTRGLWLIVLEFTVVGTAWSFQIPFGFFGVIWALGASMILMAAIVRLPMRWIAVLAATMICLPRSARSHAPGAIRITRLALGSPAQSRRRAAAFWRAAVRSVPSASRWWESWRPATSSARSTPSTASAASSGSCVSGLGMIALFVALAPDQSLWQPAGRTGRRFARRLPFPAHARENHHPVPRCREVSALAAVPADDDRAIASAARLARSRNGAARPVGAAGRSAACRCSSTSFTST